jgi:UPF0755 protein
MTILSQFFKKFFSASLLFFVIMVLLLGSAVFVDNLKPVAKKETVPFTIEFAVRPGTSMDAIAKDLEERQIIKSKIAFEIYSVLVRKNDSFQPGTYTVGPGVSTPDIVSLLTAGPVEQEVLIAPGMTIIEIEDIMVAGHILDDGQLTGFPIDTIRADYPFLGTAKTLEGFLYPDTYRFYTHADPALVVRKILDNFRDQTALLLRDSKNSDIIHWLIIASILEKEVINKKEAQTVAGIFEKRLAIGMPLQVDASIIYAKCRRFISCPALVRADFKFESPYNVYLHKGLPPTPISNPGIDAISAAVSPIRSNYLYYLSDPQTKQTIFSKTFDEHNANRIKYLFK